MHKKTTSLWPQATFLFSAAHFKEIPRSDKREFCVLGRSNVGKSSFINHALCNNTLARVSKKPGKTTLANFFALTNKTVWVDLPGYGHAKRGREEQIRWSVLVGDYCEKRENLTGVIWLCDSRHPGLAIDKEAIQWFASLHLPVFVVLTKADKLTRNEQAAHVRQFKQEFGTTETPLLYSNMSEASRISFWKEFPKWAERITKNIEPNSSVQGS